MSDDYAVPSDFWKLACAHTERTTDDGSEERREICVRCGAVVETRISRARLEATWRALSSGAAA
jgi:hypothetical protein